MVNSAQLCYEFITFPGNILIASTNSNTHAKINISAVILIIKSLYNNLNVEHLIFTYSTQASNYMALRLMCVKCVNIKGC